MASDFPTSIDNYTNPSNTDKLNNPSHSVQHQNANDAVEAIEAKVGVNGSAVTTTHDYKLGEVTGSDKSVGKTATQTLTNKTLTSPKVVAYDGIYNSSSKVVELGSFGTPVNYILLETAEAGNGPSVASEGSGSNIDLSLVAKGSGVVKADGVEVVTLTGIQSITNKAITATSISNSGILTQTGASTFVGAMTINSYDGWITDTRTWTYATGAGTNVGTFTIAGVDLTGVYNVGDKVKFTQTTIKYAVITKVAFSTDTTVTIYMGTDYTIANAAITLPAYSHSRNPVGFSIDPSKWTITTSGTSDRTTTSGTYASLTDTIVIPIGAWNIKFKAALVNSAASTANTLSYVTLSSDASSETNPQLTLYLRKRSSSAAATSTNGGTEYTESFITTTSSTTFTVMGKTNADTLVVEGSTAHATLIRAVCAYI